MQNIFWEVDGIKGESTSAQGKDMIEVLSYTASMSMPIMRNNSAGGRSVGRVVHADFVLTKYFDLASPTLAEKTCAGENIKLMKLHVWKADATGNPVEYFTIEFKNCILTSTSVAGSDDRPLESVAFSFQEISWTYAQQDKSKGGKKGQAAAADSVASAGAASPAG